MSMLRIALIIAPLALTAATPLVADPKKGGVKWPDCYCTNRGERVDMGKTSCLSVDGRSYLAKCDMSQNNPVWRDTGQLCPVSRLELPQSKPFG